MALLRSVARPVISQYMGDWIPDLVVDSTTGTTNITDAALALYGGAGYFVGWWVVFPLGPDLAAQAGANYEVRRVTDSTTTTLTITPAASATIDAVPYELHMYDPASKHLALNAAVEMGWPHLQHRKTDLALVVDGLGSNMDFETYAASAFTSWDDVSTVTEATETSRLLFGSQSMKLTAGAASAGKSQTLTVNLVQIVGDTIRFRVHAWSSTADSAYAQLYFGAGHASNTAIDAGDSTHAGDEEWQWLEVTATIPSDASEITIRIILATNGDVGYFDAAECSIDGHRINEYTVPSAIRVLESVEMQSFEDDPNSEYYPLGQNIRPLAGRRLRLKGSGVLTTFSAEASSMEIDAPQTSLLYVYALRWLSQNIALRGNDEARKRAMEDRKMWTETAAELLSNPGVSMARGGGQLHKGWWSTHWVAETQKLVLVR